MTRLFRNLKTLKKFQESQHLKAHFLLKKDTYAVNYFIFITERLIIKGTPNYASLMQFLTEGSFLSWCLSYCSTNSMPVFSEDSINNAKKVDDSIKFPYTYTFHKKKDHFCPSGYEISKFSHSKFLGKHHLSLTSPAYHIFRTASSAKSGRLWCSLCCRNLSKI